MSHTNSNQKIIPARRWRRPGQIYSEMLAADKACLGTPLFGLRLSVPRRANNSFAHDASDFFIIQSNQEFRSCSIVVSIIGPFR